MVEKYCDIQNHLGVTPSVCRSVSLIALLVSGVAGLSASYSSKADTLTLMYKKLIRR